MQPMDVGNRVVGPDRLKLQRTTVIKTRKIDPSLSQLFTKCRFKESEAAV